MIKLLLTFLVMTTTAAIAIEFISEDDVQKKLTANKVLEVSKYNVKCLLPKNSECEQKFSSKSARAYIVKVGQKSKLYLTESGLAGLIECTNLTDAPSAEASEKPAKHH